MLFRQKIRKYVSILLLLFLIFQLMPGTHGNVECLNSYGEKSTIVLSKSVTQTEIILVNATGGRSAFHIVSLEFYNSLVDNIYFPDISENKLFYYRAPTDYRKQIKQAIPHYFHGSKYKDSYLFI